MTEKKLKEFEHAHKYDLEVLDFLDEVRKLQKEATRASAELRHAYKLKQDWNLVARAIEILERATTE